MDHNMSTLGEPDEELSTRDDSSEPTLPPILRGDPIEEPLPMDIICGRGSRISHPGNRRFRQLVMENKAAYQKAKRREEKSRIAMGIVHRLTGDKDPSRFLLKDPRSNNWYEVARLYQKEKVSHALRSRPTDDRRKQARPKKQTARKPGFPPELESVVREILIDQQTLLRTLIEKEASGSQKQPGVSV